MKISKLTPPIRTEEYAYKMGLDFAANGANTTNCHFSIFSSPENTKAWNEGNKKGEMNKDFK